ncbi:TetR-like C-terminal domain-containing protein [Streptomyces sp. NPDC050504]|uniref:TetR-like C-terminal domain-containing protein n=1 Tax=Streptomyces sp. NPDC050504 TaxID=3365618 RepID=UPI0037959897
MARAGLNADRVAEAAADMADEIGFDSITMSALARHFGVRDASLYSHVKSVRELRTRVALIATRDLVDRIEAAMADRAGRPALAAFAGAYRDFAHERPGRYAATQIQLDPAVAASSDAVRRTLELIDGMLRSYGLGDPDRTDAVRLLRSAFHGYVSLEAIGGFGHPRAVSESWDRIVESLHFLLTNWPSEAGKEPGAPEPGKCGAPEPKENEDA